MPGVIWPCRVRLLTGLATRTAAPRRTNPVRNTEEVTPPPQTDVWQYMASVVRFPRLLALLLPAILAGCVVGPDYRTPQLSVPTTWHTDTNGSVKSVPLETARLARWWQTPEDPLLSRLVQEAAANNLDLQLAGARLRESRARRALSSLDFY